MTEQPTIRTDRLLLRPFSPADASDVQRLAGDRDIASTTLTIPHPYEDGAAEEWISTHRERFEKGTLVNFAITRRADGALLGAIGLTIESGHCRAELGYWVGKPFWGNGYCTEAARAVLRYGFETLGLNRIQASHLGRNPASSRVIRKIGMKHEGTRPQHVRKWGKFEDIEEYGMLKSDWEVLRKQSGAPGRSTPSESGDNPCPQ